MTKTKNKWLVMLKVKGIILLIAVAIFIVLVLFGLLYPFMVGENGLYKSLMHAVITGLIMFFLSNILYFKYAYENDSNDKIAGIECLMMVLSILATLIIQILIIIGHDILVKLAW